MTAGERLEADVRRYLDEGTRALKHQLHALNKLRVAAGLRALYIAEEPEEAA